MRLVALKTQKENIMNLEEDPKQKLIEEKELNPLKGGPMLLLLLLELVLSIISVIFGCILLDAENYVPGGFLLGLGIVAFLAFFFLIPGLHIVNPNEALVMTFFGQYYGTIKKQGYYYTHPFASSFNPTYRMQATGAATESANGSQARIQDTPNTSGKKISTKTMTLNNEKQKVNDVLGNPIIIGAIVIWKVADPTKAVFNVENYKKFLSIQCDSTIRNIARLYPYDTFENDSDEKTLRGSSQEIAESMKTELQQRVDEAGLTIQEVRITHLSYAEEIAAAMLQRQQAVAVIAARQKIVEGAVSMVKMAIDQLSEEEIVVLDDERKAAMVSNLLVVLCGNKDAQPIVNSGSIY